MSKPLTKALHTTRIVGRIARLLAQGNRNVAAMHDELLFDMVLDIIGNAPPTDPALREACLVAIRAEIDTAAAANEQTEKRWATDEGEGPAPGDAYWEGRP